MKIWTSEHIFNHPWETVTQATWRKYPNPLNPSVVGIDVIDRKLTNNGQILHTHRLISTKWQIPKWVGDFIGSCDRTCYVSEHSTVDNRNRVMTAESRNLSLCNFVCIDEKLTYQPHPTEPHSTLLKQEAVVTIKGIPLTSYLESTIANTISNNAGKGRQAMEWVIGRINAEVHELTQSAQKSMNELSKLALNVEELSKKQPIAGLGPDDNNLI